MYWCLDLCRTILWSLLLFATMYLLMSVLSLFWVSAADGELFHLFTLTLRTWALEWQLVEVVSDSYHESLWWQLGWYERRVYLKTLAIEGWLGWSHHVFRYDIKILKGFGDVKAGWKLFTHLEHPVHTVDTSVTSTHVLDVMYLWHKTSYSAGVRFC